MIRTKNGVRRVDGFRRARLGAFASAIPAAVPLVMVVLGSVVLGCAGSSGRGTVPDSTDSAGGQFTIAMIPDTQNYVDYSHQKAEGFAIDASELFLAQMEWVASEAQSAGGEIAFVASVGDTWQHPTIWIDEEHAARGIGRMDNPFFAGHFDPSEKVLEVEVPNAIEGYEKIAAADLPFGVPPGNHDYDAMYNVDTHPPNLTKPPSELEFVPEDIGLLHVGGLSSFLSAFGEESSFFADKSWYVGAHRGGTSSAQIFSAGGYRFLHIALEMQAGDHALEWARETMAAHPGLPTIVSTHDYLSPSNERWDGGFLDFTLVDPAYHNTPQQIFDKLIAPTEQIFLVLCGHYHGQGLRIDENEAGQSVYQVLADYQDRGQVGVEAGQPLGGLMGGPVGLGDGWLRLLEFDTSSDPVTISMKTYSTHYKQFADEMPEYAATYRPHEQPMMTDEEFMAAEQYELVLDDFRSRFGPPSTSNSN